MSKMYQQRREELLKRIKKSSVILLDSGKAKHKTTDQYFHYIPNRNFFFLTGLQSENMKLMLVKQDNKVMQFLFIEETTEYMRQWVGEKISKEEVSKISGIELTNIHYLDKFDTYIRSLMTYARGLGVKPPKNLFLDLYRTNTEIVPEAHLQFNNILSLYKELKVKNLNEHLSYLRMFKSKDDIKDLQKAIDITEIALNRVMDSVKVRDNELQVQADYIHEITLQGSEGYSFNTIMANGVNATVLHYEDNNSPLHKDSLILCDLGALYNNHGSDITRTYPISGSYNDRQKQIYEIVLKANKESIKFVKPGITWKELNEFAKNILIKGAKDLGIIKEDAEISKYYYHSIGHFLGLDVHDVGQYNIPLEEGMVITIEPGLYIKEEGIGVRIEDDILVTKEGNINLSKNIIKEIKDIEEYMN